MNKAIVTLSIVTGSIFAAATCQAGKSLQEAITGTSFHGQVRAGYITKNHKGADTAETESAAALGGNIIAETAPYYGFSIGAAAYTAQTLGSNDDTATKVHDDFTNDRPGKGLLGQAYLQYSFRETTFKIGRQLIDTPHADSDDIRMIPNLFEAAVLTVNDLPKTTLILAHLSEMAGWENGADMEEFENMSTKYAFTDTSGRAQGGGVTLAAVLFEGIPDTQLQAWYYLVHDALAIFYFEAGYVGTLSNDFQFSLAAQYDQATDSETFNFGGNTATDWDSKLWGLSAGLSHQPSGLSFSIAHNQTDNNLYDGTNYAQPLNGWGGGPYFTSLEDTTAEQAVKEVEATAFTIEFDAVAIGFEGLSLGYTYAVFEADIQSSLELVEQNASITIEVNDKISLEAAYAHVNDETSANQDFDQFRAFANYTF